MTELFGAKLRNWRSRGGMSQMELGLQAGVSTRHISFLETGRARPSREMVLRLADALDMPLRERNVLLLAAGFAPRYGERPLDDAELQEALRALRFLLDAHEPYPAFVLDRYWRIINWNRPQEILLRDVVGATPLENLSALDLIFEPGLMRERFVNWKQVAAAVLRRLRRQVSRVGPDDRLQEIWHHVLAAPGVDELVRDEPVDDPPAILVPLRIRDGDRIFTWFSTLAVFGATSEATLEEIVIESFFPGDKATRTFIEDVVEEAGIPIRRTRTMTERTSHATKRRLRDMRTSPRKKS